MYAEVSEFYDSLMKDEELRGSWTSLTQYVPCIKPIGGDNSAIQSSTNAKRNSGGRLLQALAEVKPKLTSSKTYDSINPSWTSYSNANNRPKFHQLNLVSPPPSLYCARNPRIMSERGATTTTINRSKPVGSLRGPRAPIVTITDECSNTSTPPNSRGRHLRKAPPPPPIVKHHTWSSRGGSLTSPSVASCRSTGVDLGAKPVPTFSKKPIPVPVGMTMSLANPKSCTMPKYMKTHRAPSPPSTNARSLAPINNTSNINSNRNFLYARSLSASPSCSSESNSSDERTLVIRQSRSDTTLVKPIKNNRTEIPTVRKISRNNINSNNNNIDNVQHKKGSYLGHSDQLHRGRRIYCDNSQALFLTYEDVKTQCSIASIDPPRVGHYTVISPLSPLAHHSQQIEISRLTQGNLRIIFY